MGILSNVSIAQFRAILSALGLVCVRTKGGHEAWSKDGMTRPVIFQTHVDPIPEFIIRSNLRTLGISREEFIRLLNS